MLTFTSLRRASYQEEGRTQGQKPGCQCPWGLAAGGGAGDWNLQTKKAGRRHRPRWEPENPQVPT